MTGVIIVGHGNFAEGMLKTAAMFCGEQPQTATICFLPNGSPDDLYAQLSSAIDNLDTGDGVLILTDLNGGTPSNQAYRLFLEGRRIEIVAGANLPMLMTVFFERDGSGLEALAEAAHTYGVMGTVRLTSGPASTSATDKDMDAEF